MALYFTPQNHMVRVLTMAVLHLLHLMAVTPVLHAATNMALPGCISKCGEVSVPYPFGVGAGCYREGFQLTCNETYNVPKLFVGNTTAEVLNISVHDGKLYINNGVVSVIGSNRYSMTWEIPLRNSIFTVSPVWNNFIVMGCGFDFLVSLQDAEETAVKCSSSCLHEHPTLATDGLCSGVGCCEASMPGAGSSYSIELASFQARNHMIMAEQPFNATVVLVEKQWWDKNNHSVLLQKAVSDGSTQSMQIKTAVKWSFSNLSCADARRSSDYGCLSSNSYCHDHWNGESSGYICRCNDNYEGNPYIVNGCQDIDECANSGIYQCFGQCINTEGSYDCICPIGTSGNPQKPDGCIKDEDNFSDNTTQ